MKAVLIILVEMILRNNEELSKTALSKKLRKNRSYITNLCATGASDDVLLQAINDLSNMYLKRTELLEFIEILSEKSIDSEILAGSLKCNKELGSQLRAEKQLNHELNQINYDFTLKIKKLEDFENELSSKNHELKTTNTLLIPENVYLREQLAKSRKFNLALAYNTGLIIVLLILVAYIYNFG